MRIGQMVRLTALALLLAMLAFPLAGRGSAQEAGDEPVATEIAVAPESEAAPPDEGTHDASTDASATTGGVTPEPTSDEPSAAPAVDPTAPPTGDTDAPEPDASEISDPSVEATVEPTTVAQPTAESSVEFQDSNAEASAVTIVTFRAVDQHGNAVLGEVCIAEFADAGGGVHGAPGSAFCTTPDPLQNGQVFSAFRDPGAYVMAVTSAPAGYTAPADTLYTVIADETTDVPLVFTNNGDAPTGSIVVHTIDDGDPAQDLTGACYLVREDNNGSAGQAVAPLTCDGDDGTEDGFTTIPAVLAGSYLLEETSAPNGYSPANPQPVTVVLGQETPAQFINTLLGTFTLTAEDENGDPVEGACFAVFEDAGGGALGELIVGGEDLCSDATGHVLNRNQAPGNYIAVNFVAPDGFGTPDDVLFSVASSQDTPVPVVLEEVDPNTPGRVQISKQDNLQDALAGACFKVYEDDNGARGGELSGIVCDDDDGANDGSMTIDGIAPGDVLIRETTAPAGFAIGADASATIKPGQRLFVTIINQPLPDGSSFVLTAEDEAGDPLAGACFEVYTDAGNGALGELIVGGTGLCSDDIGFVLSRNQEPGDYVVVTVTTPDGFDKPADVRFTVGEREEVPVTVVFAKTAVNGGGDGNGNTDDNGDDEVTTLPKTGAGSTSDHLTWLALAGFLALGALGASSYLRRRA